MRLIVLNKRAVHISLALTLLLSITLPLVSVPKVSAFEGGDGSMETPYRIGDCEQLQDVQDDLDAFYVLANDIECSETAGWNGGAGFEPIGQTLLNPFEGDFDGDGHTISSLTIDRSGSNGVGLFGYFGDAIVHDVHLEDATVTGSDYTGALIGYGVQPGLEYQADVFNSGADAVVDGDTNVGGLIGYADHINIENSYSSGLVTSSGTIAGGLVGFINEESNILESYSTSDVTSDADNAGGLIGYSDDNVVVEDSYASGDVHGTNYCGGLVGYAYYIEAYRTYYSGIVTCTFEDYLGGLLGYDDDVYEFTDSFWDLREDANPATTQGDMLGASGSRSTADMLNIETYTTDPDLIDPWDFETVWDMDEETNGGYPYLRNTGPPVTDLSIFEDFNLLVVENGENHERDYLDSNEIDYDVIETTAFAEADASYFLDYDAVIYEPGDNPQYDDLHQGLVNLSEAMEQQKIIVSIRVAGNEGNADNIDFLGTDFILEYGAEVEFADPDSRFLTGEDIGGLELTTDSFFDWDDTYHGWLDNTPTSQPGYNEILSNELGPAWIEYAYEQGLVMVDTLTAIDGGWGFGSDEVADNYIRYIAYQVANFEGIEEDYNGDGTPDSEQPQLSSYISSITGKRVVIDVGEGCELNIDDIVEESDLDVPDSGFDYDNGLFDFEAECNEGFTTTINLFYYGVSKDDLIVRKYNPNTNAYFNLTGEYGATLEERLIDDETVTVAAYQITDGGDLDMDGEVNGFIVDPVGIASSTVGSPNTGLRRQ